MSFKSFPGFYSKRDLFIQCISFIFKYFNCYTFLYHILIIFRASQGRVESEDSRLFRMANELTKDYRLNSHLCLKHIAPVFFAKLTIPTSSRKKNVIKTKGGREKLRALLRHPNDIEDHFFEDEVTINQASAFLEKVMSRVYYKKGVSQTETPTVKTADLHTDIEAIYQLEVMLTEPDFNKDIPSPRSIFF